MKAILFCVFLLPVVEISRAQFADPGYNISWSSPSKNSSESMPCGGGDIGLNVWVENGDLLCYIARSGFFNEDNALMKAGRIRIRLFPNPFEGNDFKQELHLQQGYITIEGQDKGVRAVVTIRADVFRPVVHFTIKASKKISAEAAYESWRYKDRLVHPREHFGNSWKWAAPKNHIYKKDSIGYSGNEILFFHQNSSSTIFDATVEQQGMEEVKDELYNPLRQLIFGGSLGGRNFSASGIDEGMYAFTDFRSWKLKSNKPARDQALQLYLFSAREETAANWKSALDSLKKAGSKEQLSFERSAKWWQQFWQRSFIHIDKAHPGSKAWEIGRNFQLFRYMLAANAGGNWPTKFNGGLFTVDPVYTDSNYRLTPDYRNWGGGVHTAQNQRLVYFPMIRNGDWDLLQPQLNFYLRLLKTAELRSKIYWQHGGACFTEQMENFGLPNYAEYGQKRPPGFDRGLEYNAWLEYLWDGSLEFCLMMLEEEQYTGKNISGSIPFIESCLQFFDEHYQYRARERGRKALNENGKLILYPGSAAETYKMAYNASSTIAGLQTIARRLLSLAPVYLGAEKRKQWEGFLERLPAISYTQVNGRTLIAPAKLWERINNVESPQLYPVYPWGLFGIGKPGLDTALNTWHYDTSVQKFRSHIGWKQDNIWAARLGLTAEAWRLTSLKLQNAPRRFPTFWGPGFDWVPDHNWGGSGMIGLQEMLLQTEGKRILLLPAWPREVDVHFKLHAPYNTTVEAELKNGQLQLLKVIPQTRANDVELIMR